MWLNFPFFMGEERYFYKWDVFKTLENYAKKFSGPLDVFLRGSTKGQKNQQIVYYFAIC